MTALRQCKPGAADYLADTAVPHKHWASYAFPGRRSDHVTSNLSEIANSALRQHRELPPLQMMAGVYDHEMAAFHERVQAAALWKQPLAPHPHAMFLNAVQLSRRMNVAPASDTSGLVACNMGKTFEVTLATDPTKGVSKCTCGVPNWMLLPCAHVCCLALALGKDATTYAWYYWTSATWRRIYQTPYAPISRDDLQANEVEAPAIANKRSRPATKRKEAGQGKGKRKSSTNAFFADSSSSAGAGSSTPAPPVPTFCRTCGDGGHATKQCRNFH